MGIKLEFRNSNGRRTVLGENVLFAFHGRNNLERLCHMPYLLVRLITNTRFYSIFLLAKGFFNMVAKNSEVLRRDEYFTVCMDVIGFEPESATCMPYGLKFDVSTMTKMLGIIYGVVEIIAKNQYNLSEENMRGKVVIDAGGNMGVFSIYAARLGAKKIYSFEPLEETCRMLERNVSLNNFGHVVQIVNAGLGKNGGKGYLNYSFDGDACATFEQKKKMPHRRKVAVVKLDSFLRMKGRVDFIKIDTEGCERNILWGAKKTLQACKPVLSFSAYHKPNDRTTLPTLVENLRHDYNCSLLNRCEDDIYCV